MRTTNLTLNPRFAAIADFLIPAFGGMPAATEVGVPALLHGKLSRYRPDLVKAVCEILRRESSVFVQDFVDNLAIEDPKGFEQLFEAVAGANFQSG